MNFRLVDAAIQRTDIALNEAVQFCGGICALDESRLRADDVSVVSNAAGDAGGGIAVSSSSSLLCYSCTFENNIAFRGAGLYASTSDIIPIIVQLQDSKFKNNRARAYGGGIDFEGSQSKTVNCSHLNTTCSHIVLLNTDLVNNFANHSGAAFLTSTSDKILASCEYNGGKQENFLTRESLHLLKPLKPNKLCPSWTRNRLASNATGGIIGTLGQTFSLTINSTDDVMLSQDTKRGYVLEDVSSGIQLPRINIVILDGSGVGPAPTSPYTFQATMSSPDRFFPGFYVENITGGKGYFKDVVGFRSPGNYTIQLTSDTEGIEPLNITVHVRECRIGEEPTRDYVQCQECDDFSYNFNQTKPNGCATCPENGNCRGRYIVPKEGYWHKSPCHSSVKECLTEKACKYDERQEKLQYITSNLTDCGANETVVEKYSDVLCKKGYKGPLCGSCKESYGKSLKFRCIKCPRNGISLLILISLFCCLFVAAAFTTRGSLPSKPKKQDGDTATSSLNVKAANSSRSVAINVQIVEMMRDGHVPPEHFRELQRQHTRQVASDQGDECELTKWRTTEIFKIMINFLQVTAVAAAVNIRWTAGLLAMFITSEYAGVSITAAVSLPIDCIVASSAATTKAVWRIITGISIPIAVIGCFAGFWGYMTHRKKENSSYFWKRLVLSTAAVVYISYLGLTKSAVRAFYCIDIYDDDEYLRDSKQKRWAMDTTIKCYEKNHFVIVALGVSVLSCVSVAFPSVIAFLLSRNRNQNRQEGNWTLEALGFLHRAYKVNFMFWESVVMFRKACLSIIVVFSYPLGGPIQGLLALLVLSICQYLHFSCLPYRQEFHNLNYVESASLIVSSLTFMLGQFFGIERCSDLVRTLVATVIITINTGFFCFLVSALFQSLVHHMRITLQSDSAAVDSTTPWWKTIVLFICSRLNCCCKQSPT